MITPMAAAISSAKIVTPKLREYSIVAGCPRILTRCSVGSPTK